ELPIVNGETPPTDLPLIVLVDGNTASAAEIVAGSLRDYDRAMVVGEQTFGKGSVQRIFDFQDGASLRVTVAEWFTPSKGRIQDDGIRPDVLLTTGDNAMGGGDPFVAAATSFLNSGKSRPTDLALIPATPPSGTPAATR
ncbi:MAG: S41 family peptidase, partial [Thermomicrobiales bacterium]